MVNLIVDDLFAHYFTSKGPIHAVNDVSFDLVDGESIGIAGESACGKSSLGLSLIRMLLGGKITGSILFDGEPILEISDLEFNEKFRWKKIAMVFQGAMNSLDPVFTIEKQLLEILKQHNFKNNQNDVIVNAINAVGLDPDVLKKYPHELSGGMKQRVVIALAILLKPKLIIADEPTTALDVLIQAQIIDLFKKLKKNGTSFMLITHDLGVLSEISDKIGIMYGGQMVEFGSSEEIYTNPKHPYTQGLLDSIPKLKENQIKFIRGMPPSLLDPPSQCRFIDRCPLVIDKCKQVPPKFKTQTGYVRCWLYEDKS